MKIRTHKKKQGTVKTEIKTSEVVRPSSLAENGAEDWQHCCKYCKHYLKGRCVNASFSNEEAHMAHDFWFKVVCEEGKVQEILTEALSTYSDGPGKDFLQSILKLHLNHLSKMGKKTGLKEAGVKFTTELFKLYEEFAEEISPELDEALNIGLQGYNTCVDDSGEFGVPIANPDTVYCSLWE